MSTPRPFSLVPRSNRRGAVRLGGLVLLGLAGLVLAAAFGAPVASWAAAGMVPLIALVCFSMMFGAEDLAKGLLKPLGALLLVAFLVAPAGHIVRGLLRDPQVQFGALVGLVVLVLCGLVLLAGKAIDTPASAKKAPKPKVRGRARIVDPQALPPAPQAQHGQPKKDEIGLFRRKP